MSLNNSQKWNGFWRHFVKVNWHYIYITSSILINAALDVRKTYFSVNATRVLSIVLFLVSYLQMTDPPLGWAEESIRYLMSKNQIFLYLWCTRAATPFGQSAGPADICPNVLHKPSWHLYFYEVWKNKFNLEGRKNHIVSDQIALQLSK